VGVHEFVFLGFFEIVNVIEFDFLVGITHKDLAVVLDAQNSRRMCADGFGLLDVLLDGEIDMDDSVPQS